MRNSTPHVEHPESQGKQWEENGTAGRSGKPRRLWSEAQAVGTFPVFWQRLTFFKCTVPISFLAIFSLNVSVFTDGEDPISGSQGRSGWRWVWLMHSLWERSVVASFRQVENGGAGPGGCAVGSHPEPGRGCLRLPNGFLPSLLCESSTLPFGGTRLSHCWMQRSH